MMKDTWDKSSGPMHPNATLNPTFANFHRVVLWYCDGASFAGSVAAPVVNTTSSGKKVSMYFRGQQILKAVLAKLKQPDYGLGHAKQVLLTGCSAGGMSTYLHADAVKTEVTNPALTRYKVAALSGFFLDHPTAAGVPATDDNYHYMFHNVFVFAHSEGDNDDRMYCNRTERLLDSVAHGHPKVRRDARVNTLPYRRISVGDVERLVGCGSALKKTHYPLLSAFPMFVPSLSW